MGKGANRYEYLEHTADLKFRSWGETLEEAFSNALYAMYDFMTSTEKVALNIEKEIILEAEDLESLLYLWLEEFLVYLDSEFFVVHEIIKIKIIQKQDGYRLEATVVGDENRGQYEFSGGVKAVTYNEMSVEEKDGMWMVTVVLDI